MTDASSEPPPPGVSIEPPSTRNSTDAPPLPLGPSKGLVTLIVKHVPAKVEPSTLQEVFKCVGAVVVRPCNAEGKMRGVVFVDFADAGLAARARDQLHGLKILNKTLAVEFARPPSAGSALYPPPPKSSPGSSSGGTGGPLPPQPDASKGPSRPESIAPGLKLAYPFPPHLRYSYPPPDTSVLHNIQSALVAVPRFYTQVLHLMNKMNLPPPFTSVFPQGPSPPVPPTQAPQFVRPHPPPTMEPADATAPTGTLLPGRGADVSMAGHLGAQTSAMPPPQASAPPQPPLRARSSDVSADMATKDRSRGNDGSESESESESELESDEDAEIGQLSSGKRRKNRPVEHRKRRRRGAGEATLETAGVREVPIGEGSGFREVRQRVKKTTMQIKLDVPSITARTAKLPIPPVRKPRAASPNPQTSGPAGVEAAPQPATREELKAGQVSQEEISANPAFKNYTPGEATPVLYIKNIAKDVTVDDVRRTFGSFLAGGGTGASSSEAIRLMQEGRMKGQAFVTFADVSAAEEAMAFTHGYLLKGKPLIVQFGRKAKAS